MSDAIHKTLVDAADFLNEQSVPFAVIGGIATSVRGEPRFTADVDIVVGIDTARALELLEEIAYSEFRPLFDDVSEVVESAFLLPLRHKETKVKVDLAIGLTGFERQIIQRATDVEFAGRAIPFARSEDLILLKLLASRPRDIDDVAGIVVRQGETLDWEYLLRTGQQLQEVVGQDLVPHLLRLRRG